MPDLREERSRHSEGEGCVEYWRFSRRDVAERKIDTESFEVPQFPRSLSDDINAVGRAEFRIVKIEEPRPSDEMARQRDWLNR